MIFKHCDAAGFEQSSTSKKLLKSKRAEGERKKRLRSFELLNSNGYKAV